MEKETFPQSVTGSFPANPEILRGTGRTRSGTYSGRRPSWTRGCCPFCIWDVFVILGHALSLDSLRASAFFLLVPGDSGPFAGSFRGDLPFWARSDGSGAQR